jgi:hypothetical protein
MMVFNMGLLLEKGRNFDPAGPAILGGKKTEPAGTAEAAEQPTGQARFGCELPTQNGFATGRFARIPSAGHDEPHFCHN